MTDFKFYPESVVWEVTFACNMKCIHCGTAAGTARHDELSTDEAFQVIDELAALDCNMITISGGEPLLRKDWKRLALRTRERGINPYIITNGYAVNDKVIEDFADVGFGNIGVSFDGTERTHNYIRQRNDAFSRTVSAMRLLTGAGLRYCAVSQISNINLNELDDIRQVLLDVGCNLWRIQMTTHTGRMPKDFVLSLENYPKLIDKILEYKKDNTIEIDAGENIGYYGCKGMELSEEMPYLGCFAGTRVAGICSNGDVKGCLSMQDQFIEGNIRDSSFTEIWDNPDGFTYNRKFTKETATGACYGCKYLPLCRGGCATTSVSATGERANNPYCIYQMEKAEGITRDDTKMVTDLLRRFQEQPVEESVASRRTQPDDVSSL